MRKIVSETVSRMQKWKIIDYNYYLYAGDDTSFSTRLLQSHSEITKKFDI